MVQTHNISVHPYTCQRRETPLAPLVRSEEDGAVFDASAADTGVAEGVCWGEQWG